MSEVILNRMLSRVGAEFDKRDTSLLYMALAAMSDEIMQLQIENTIFEEQSNLKNATGINLDNRAFDHGVERKGATAALRIIETTARGGTPFIPTIGSRFGVPNARVPINYVVINNSPSGMPQGRSIVRCEILGTIGNEYVSGFLLPLQPMSTLLSVNMVGTYQSGQDEETDTSLRERVIERINVKTFGGNVAQYRSLVNSLPGIGECRVIPTPTGIRTVKIAIIDPNFMPVDEPEIARIQGIIDPPVEGMGIGEAPIGHLVTVTTPEEYKINVSATLTLASDYTLPMVQIPVEEKLREYMLSLRRQWPTANTLYIYQARVISLILDVPGVVNVTNLQLNGATQDITIILTENSYPIPVLGLVVLT